MIETVEYYPALIRINMNITPRSILSMHLLVSSNKSVIHVLCLNHIIETHIIINLQLVDLSKLLLFKVEFHFFDADRMPKRVLTMDSMFRLEIHSRTPHEFQLRL